MSRIRTLVAFAVVSLITSTLALAAPVTFTVTLADSARKEPATGRVVVYLAHANPRGGGRGEQPANGFNEEDPQPMFGVDVQDLKPGNSVTLDDNATSFPAPMSKLAPGKYVAQAVLDMFHDNSNWRLEPGNVCSETVDFEIGADGSLMSPVQITLTQVMKPRELSESQRVAFVRIRSKLLSDFRGHDVFLTAGIALPQNYDKDRAYPAVYEVPGFGGDHTSVFFKANRRGKRPRGSPAEQIANNTFWIFLDPESGNGHTLFCDSDVNGPCGRALIEELIPAIESRFKLITDPSGRIVTGHSSGGWSSLWLATEYPKTFGACWSSSPDMVDFRKFEKVNLYEDANMYTDSSGKDWAAARFDGKETMTTRQEIGMGIVLGPRNDSGQQWDSWMACWGHRTPNGMIRPLYNAETGKIDKAEAETYRRFDITDRLKKDPERFVPIFHQRVHLLVGGGDTYYLNEAVALLKKELDTLDPMKADVAWSGHVGYVKIVGNFDHQTITDTPDYGNWAKEMLEYLRAGNHIPATQPGR